jgi:hypothetical protein
LTAPAASSVRALEYVTGQPVATLGFDTAAERYGLDPDEALAIGSGPWIPVADPKAQPGPLSGIWLSSYEYESTGRGATFTSHHYVAVVQHGTRLQVRSTPGSRSRLLMDLTANGQVLTGTWTEETSPAGYYKGARTNNLVGDQTWHVPDADLRPVWRQVSNRIARARAAGVSTDSATQSPKPSQHRKIHHLERTLPSAPTAHAHPDLEYTWRAVSRTWRSSAHPVPANLAGTG